MVSILQSLRACLLNDLDKPLSPQTFHAGRTRIRLFKRERFYRFIHPSGR
jgi:hypothetical protein